MKMTSKFVLAALLILSLAVSPAKADGKIATINLQKVFDKYWKREQAQSALKEKEASLDKDYKTMLADFKKTKDEYDSMMNLALDQSVTQAERDKRKASAENKLLEVNTMKNSIQAFEENTREQMDAKIRTMRTSILSDITTAVKAKAQASGFSMVIDTAAETPNGTPIILFNNGENDLTDTILNQLNAAAPTAATKPADASK